MEAVLATISIPAIVIIVYWFINLLKYLVGENEKFSRGIPLIASFTGAVLGVVLFYLQPDIILADNVIKALILGGASGLAATGTNQVFKQLLKFKNDGEEVVVEDKEESKSKEKEK